MAVSAYYVQQDTVTSASTSYVGTLGQSPNADDWILVWCSSHRADRRPTGVTDDGTGSYALKIESSSTTNGDASGQLYAKKADGTETEITVTFGGSQRFTPIIVFVSTADGTDPFDGIGENETYLASTTPSINTGDATAAESEGLSLAFMASLNGGSWTSPVPDFTATTTLICAPGITDVGSYTTSTNVYCAAALATAAYSSTGAKTCTFETAADTGTPVYGAIVNLFGGGTAPVVSVDPSNTTRAVGQTATFTSAADDGTPQWQIDTGGGFSNISGATSATYVTPTLVIGDNGNDYRCVWTNGTGSTNSAAATLTVTAAVKGRSLFVASNPLGQSEVYSLPMHTTLFSILETDVDDVRLGVALPVPGTVRNILVYCSANTANGPLLAGIARDRSGTVIDTGIEVTVPTGETGWFEAGADQEYSALTGDYIWIRSDNTGASSGSYTFNTIIVEFEPDDDLALTILGANSAGSTAITDAYASTETFLTPYGKRDFTTTGVAGQIPPLECDLVYFSGSTGTCTRTTDLVFKQKKNGSDAGGSITFAGNDTNVHDTDTTGTVSFNGTSDEYEVAVDVGSGSGTFNFEKWHTSALNYGGSFAVVAAGSPGGTVMIEGTRYINPGGYINETSTEANAQLKIPAGFRFQPDFWIIGVGDNNQTADTVLTVRANGSDTALTRTIVTGDADSLIKIDASSLTFEPGDLVTIKAVTPAKSGQCRIKQVGFVGVAIAAAYVIDGDVTATLTPAATLAYNQNHAIAGDVTATLTPASSLAYNQNPAIVGDITATLTPAATLAYSQGNEIVGNVMLAMVPAADLVYNQGHSIGGDVTVTLTASAGMQFGSGFQLAGDVTVSLTPAATLAYNQNRLFDGAVSVEFTPASGMQFGSGYLITGDVTATLTPTAALAYNRNHTIAGAVTVTMGVAAGLQYGTGGAILGDVTINVAPAAALLYSQNPAIIGQVTVSIEVDGTPAYHEQQDYTLSGDVTATFTPAAGFYFGSLLPDVPTDRTIIIPADDRTITIEE